jgi:hypothetical protein
MREVDGAYGGEMSAHHYFRDFLMCSGMIPWLLARTRVRIRQVAGRTGGRRIKAFPRAAKSIASCGREEVLAEAE